MVVRRRTRPHRVDSTATLAGHDQRIALYGTGSYSHALERNQIAEVTMRLQALLILLCLAPEAIAGQQRWVLREELRLGAGDEGPASFSDIRGIAVNAKGWIFVLEFSTQDIRVFDAQGRHLKTVERKGSGPGELREANGMLRGPDGNLWLNDPPNGRFTVLDSEGAFLRHHTVSILGYGYLWLGFFDTRGRLVDPIFLQNGADDRRPAFRVFSPDLATADTVRGLDCTDGRPVPPPWRFAREGGTMYMGVPFAAGPISAFDFPDAQWCGWSSEFRMEKRSLRGGQVLATLRGTARALAVTGRERDSIRHDITASVPNAHPDLSAIPSRKPIIRRTFVDDRHRVWVDVSIPQLGTRFDLFDASGRALGTVETPLRFSVYHPLLIEEDTLYGIVLGEDDVPQVVRARIVPGR